MWNHTLESYTRIIHWPPISLRASVRVHREISNFGNICTLAHNFISLWDRTLAPNDPLEADSGPQFYVMKLRPVYDFQVPKGTGRHRDTGYLISKGLFPQKSPIIIGSFVERDLQITASYAFSAHCTIHRAIAE